MRLTRVMLLASAVALAACSGSDGDTTDDAPATVAPTATADAAPTAEVEESTTTTDTAAPVTSSEVVMPETVPTAVAEPDEDVFSFGRDDLCQWVTEDEVAEMVSAVYPWEGNAELEQPVVDEAPCTWKLTGGDGDGYLYADGGGPYDFAVELAAGLAAEPAVEYSEVGQANTWPFAVSGHPELSEGVLVHSAGFGVMTFWMPPREEFLSLTLLRPDQENPFTGEDRTVLVADAFLQELGWVPTNRTAPATTDSNTTDTSAPAPGDVNQPGGTTITVSLDAIEGLRDHAVDAWVLPVELNEDKDAIGGTSFRNITDDPFSASQKIQPQDEDTYFDVTTGESPIVEPGTYRFIIEAYVPSGPMHYGCEMPIEVDGGEQLVLTVSSLPSYTGDGLHWTSPEELEYPDCPG